ncbi:MAG: META domain-containing protein [Ignavibacteria bacterium]|nr:META domain-containing protein [Ignavibacteria bacterium]
MACPELEKETAFMKAIQNSASYKISGDKLTLSDINGNVILVFRTL